MGLKFNPTTISIVAALHIGVQSEETPVEYYRRIAEPKHDDTTHEFTSSKTMPGVCAECGWIHPDLPCSECDISVKKHAALSAELFKDSPDGGRAGKLKAKITPRFLRDLLDE